MELSMKDTYTQTSGTDRGEIFKTFHLEQITIDKIYGIKGGMNSYSNYLIYYNSGKRQGKSRLYDKLKSLKENLEREYSGTVDPIHYLIDLYYIEGLSIEKIYIKLKNRGLSYESHSGIEKLFKQVFKWELRDSSGSEVTSKIKSVNGQTNKAREKSDRINKEKYSVIQKYFSSIISDILEYSESDLIGIDTLKKKDKILFLLSKIYGIEIETIQSDLILLRDNKNIGPIILANTINDIFEKNLPKHQIITVYSKDIPNILKK